MGAARGKKSNTSRNQELVCSWEGPRRDLHTDKTGCRIRGGKWLKNNGNDDVKSEATRWRAQCLHGCKLWSWTPNSYCEFQFLSAHQPPRTASQLFIDIWSRVHLILTQMPHEMQGDSSAVWWASSIGIWRVIRDGSAAVFLSPTTEIHQHPPYLTFQHFFFFFSRNIFTEFVRSSNKPGPDDLLTDPLRWVIIQPLQYFSPQSCFLCQVILSVLRGGKL